MRAAWGIAALLVVAGACRTSSRVRLPLAGNPGRDVAEACAAGCADARGEDALAACYARCPGADVMPGVECQPTDLPPRARCATATRFAAGRTVAAVIGGTCLALASWVALFGLDALLSE